MVSWVKSYVQFIRPTSCPDKMADMEMGIPYYTTSTQLTSAVYLTINNTCLARSPNLFLRLEVARLQVPGH